MSWRFDDDDTEIVLCGGPARIYDDGADRPDLPTRPVGFAPPARDVDPQLWDGDQA